MVELGIAAAKCLLVVLMVLQLSAFLLWVERKGSALIQDRIGANRAAIFGILPVNLGVVNTLVADPLKLFTKEDFVPERADRLIHALAPFLALFPAVVTFAAIPFGDRLEIGGRVIDLRAVDLDVGLLYIVAMVAMGVYGVVLAGWSSNNRWALLGAIRGSAQMISYEVALGLALVSMVLTYGTLDLQEMVRAQGRLWFGFLPAWGVFYQPLACLLVFTAGMAESKRVPFDLPEAESELISGYFTEYSGGKQAAFMLADFAEVVVVAGFVTTLFFGGWQVPLLGPDGWVLPGGRTIPVAPWLVTVLQVAAFTVKVLFFCWLQILIRWTVPRFRYDQLMNLGWKGMIPLALANLVATAAVVLMWGQGA
ncbi:MAG: NADH-quinone oxidoreductase subunit H [Candidatus Dadabacteria bacterium]|nr:MAG: NADH-quinone oxidoreductase subunit H [Candidatus Dadabacteria bacterium]